MSLVPWRKKEEVARSADMPLSWDEFMSYYQYGGSALPMGLQFTQTPSREEEITPTYAGYSRVAYKSNAVVLACLVARASLFSEARFQWRQIRNGRPGDLFGTPDLAPLEEPWPNGSTGDLLVRMMQDYDLAGNFYGRRVRSGIQRMRPDWVSIVLGSNMDTDNVATALDAVPIGYVYHPGGRHSGEDPVPLRVEEVCHFTGLTPDPEARWRGMSWLTAILTEIQADRAATSHKARFFEEGGPNQAIIVEMPNFEEFQSFTRDFRTSRQGNPYKTLFFEAGTKPEIKTVGSDMQQMDFKVTQGHGETRICMAANVPPIVIGASEGLESATYSNYALAMRRFADLTMRPLWRAAARCLQSVLIVPAGAELWYDDRDIPALKDDVTARADVFAKTAAGGKLLIDAGYEPESVTAAMAALDLTRLTHTGLPTVQVQQQAQLPPARSVADELEALLLRR